MLVQLTERLPSVDPPCIELKPHNIVPEVIFVDDNSQDGSVEEVKKLQDAKYDVRIIVRTTERGLSSAVLRGFKEASHEVLVCMDADLQHDPKYLPALVGPIIANTADFTVGSRHVGGGGIEGWSLHRKLLSWGATLAASPLVKCSDPMSGFFSLRKSTLNRAEVLNPLGYKIGLELMVRCKCTRIKEIPIVFKDRELGESKLTMKTNILYLIHLLNLYAAAKPQYLLVLLLIVLAIIVIIFRRFVK